MAQQYSLKWNNHQPNFISMFAMLRNTQTLVDVTLAAEGRQLHAHKMVLSACSPYFHSLFVENPSQHPIVILKDVAFSDLRTIVDFMYYGEVNITQEELPQMLHSAKSLKVKGLTETESTSVMRSHSSDFAYETSGETSSEQVPDATGEQIAEPSNEPPNETPSEPAGEGASQRRTSASPANSPSSKKRRRRKSSNGSTSINMVGEENRDEPNIEINHGRDGITLSSVLRRRDFPIEENTQQNTEPPTISIDDLNVDHHPPGMPQGGQWSMMEHTYPRYTNSCFGGAGLELMTSLRLRRANNLKRQSRVEERVARRQASEPYMHLTLPPPAPAPPLRKHHSYPQTATRFYQAGRQQVSSLLIGPVTVMHQPLGVSARAGAVERAGDPAAPTQRASHTPAARSGPPLSCNFCWNTVDLSGRILRRKTQYHCPECRTNLCIVPCFHEYHEAEREVASVR